MKVNENYNSVITCDTDYLPKESNIKLNENENNEKIKFFIVDISNNHDVNYAILEATMDNLTIIEEKKLPIIAEGYSYTSMAKLIYGLQHPERLLYKSFISDLNEILENRYTQDDMLLKNELNKL